MKATQKLHNLGQSLWLDNITRDLLNSGTLLRDLRMPDFHKHAVNVPSPGAVDGQDTLVLGKFLRDVALLNQDQRNFRVFGPDETLSNLLGAVFEMCIRDSPIPTRSLRVIISPEKEVN